MPYPLRWDPSFSWGALAYWKDLQPIWRACAAETACYSQPSTLPACLQPSISRSQLEGQKAMSMCWLRRVGRYWRYFTTWWASCLGAPPGCGSCWRPCVVSCNRSCWPVLKCRPFVWHVVASSGFNEGKMSFASDKNSLYVTSWKLCRVFAKFFSSVTFIWHPVCVLTFVAYRPIETLFSFGGSSEPAADVGSS